MLKPIGCCGTTTGAGMKPPSVPIWIHAGPAVAGSGIPLAVSANWFAGLTLTGTILTSVQLVGAPLQAVVASRGVRSAGAEVEARLVEGLVELQVERPIVVGIQDAEPYGPGRHLSVRVDRAVDERGVHEALARDRRVRRARPHRRLRRGIGVARIDTRSRWQYSFGTSPTSMHPAGSPFTQTGVGGLNHGP